MISLLVHLFFRLKTNRAQLINLCETLCTSVVKEQNKTHASIQFRYIVKKSFSISREYATLPRKQKQQE